MNKFVVLEGIDGSGKNTHLFKLYNYFYNARINIGVSREPTNSHYGKKIREIYSNSKNPYDRSEELFSLHTYDRKLHQDYIKDILNHMHIICNRYILSSIAYQDAQGIDEKRIIEANKDFIQPNLTLLLDVPVDVAMNRLIKGKGTREVFEQKEFLKKVRNNYLKHASLDRKIILLNGTPPIEEVNNNLILFLQQEFTSN